MSTNFSNLEWQGIVRDTLEIGDNVFLETADHFINCRDFIKDFDD